MRFQSRRWRASAGKTWRVSVIVKPEEICVAGAEHQPGDNYGQRKPKSEKRNQEAEERKAESGPGHVPPGSLMERRRQ
jgi:hypothetical protein